MEKESRGQGFEDSSDRERTTEEEETGNREAAWSATRGPGVGQCEDSSGGPCGRRIVQNSETRNQNAEAERKGIERSRDSGIECEEQGQEHDSNRSQRSEVRAQNAELRTGTMDEKTRVRTVDWHSSICNIAHISWPHERRPNFPIPNTIAPIPFPTPPMPPP